MTDTDRDAVERQIEQAEEAAIHLPLSKPIIGRLCSNLRALLAAKEAAEAERDEAYARGYHDCQQKGITEGRLELIDGPELLAAKAEAAALREGLEVAREGLETAQAQAQGTPHQPFCEMVILTCADTIATLDQPKEGGRND